MNMSLKLRMDYKWWSIIVLLAAIYSLVNLALPRGFISGSIGAYILQPILWGIVIWVVLISPRQRPAGRAKYRRLLIELGIAIASFQLFLSIIGGVFSGFGHSPNLFTPKWIFINLIYASTALVGMELSRAWLLNRLPKQRAFLIVGLITLVYTFLSAPLNGITALDTTVESVKFTNSIILPLFAENLLASFLAFLGGPLPAIAYRGVLQAFEWFCPILPDLTWGLKGLLGTLIPIAGMVFIQRVYSAQTIQGKSRRQTRKDSFPLGWLITSIIAVMAIWFSVGIFSYYPTMIASGSMRPSLEVGDIVIVEKASADSIKQGDIIQYREGGMTIIHRVVDIMEGEGRGKFITKGDANSVHDSTPVSPQQLNGKVVLTIPKIGWVSIFVKQLFTG